MSWLSGTSEWVTAGWLSSAYPGIGATGAAIKAAGALGDSGPSIAINDGLVDAKEYIYQIVSQPSPSGSVTLTELAQSTMVVPTDGLFVWTYRLWEDGVAIGSTYSVTTTVGVTALTSANSSQNVVSSTGSVTIGSIVYLTAASASQAGASASASARFGTTLIEDVQAILTPLAPAGGVWYGVNTTEPPVYPYVVWQRIASSDNVTMQGPSNLQNTRIQIDVFSLRISEANTLRDALDTAFNSASLTNIPLSTSETYEDMIRGFRLMREYSIWATN